MLNRRGFLSRILLAPVAAYFAPKLAPVIQPHTLGSFGAEPTWHSWHTLGHPGPETFTQCGATVGNTIHVRLPQRWTKQDSLQPYLHDAMITVSRSE